MYATLRSIGILGGSVIGTALILAAPQRLAAQVGITSGLAQVTLVARANPQGSIEAVARGESSVDLRLAANTSYKLVVRKTGVSTARIWVRSATGNFEELKAGLPVIVAQDSHYAGDQQVQYRMETPDVGGAPELPSVVYDLVISPTI